MYNGEIISYAINERANFEQITEMLDNAFERLPDDTGLILHSDQGWQYQNIRYQKRLSDKGIRQSMARKGNCLDNAVMEKRKRTKHLTRNRLRTGSVNVCSAVLPIRWTFFLSTEAVTDVFCPSWCIRIRRKFIF